MNPRPVSQVVFYIFSPCLIFTLLTQNELGNGDILRMGSFAVISTILVGVLTWMIGKALRLRRRMMAGVLLASMFVNAGNFGLSVVLFAFGETALSYASIYFVTVAIMAYSLGVVIASMGSADLGHALKNLLKIPTIYSLLLALLFLQTGWQIPLFLERTTKLLGDAAIPGMLILLGLQLKTIQWSGNIVPIIFVNIMRLLAAPLIVILISPFFGMAGPDRQAGILQAAMPTAVLTTVLATEFDAEPAFVTATVMTTTLASAFTLTPLMAYLGG
jgi:predicted permease